MAEDFREKTLESELEETNRLLKLFISKKYVFLRGVLSGLGASLGATLVIALLLWITSQLEFIPLIGDLAKFVNSFLENSVTSSPSPVIPASP